MPTATARSRSLALRGAAIGRPILVLYAIPPSLALVAGARNITVTASDADLLRELLEALQDQKTPVLALELEVETGLGRGGFAGPALVEAAQAIRQAPGAVMSGMWTHLQAPEDEARTADQLDRFERATA